MKHYNSGHVWGKIANVKKDKSDQGTPYLSIVVECPNELWGNIKTYGRLWGKEKVAAFMDHFKAHPHDAYRFQGFFSQYSKNGECYSNYTFFSWQTFTGTEYRAVFILTGEVMGIEEDKIFLHLDREGKGDYKDIPEDFEVYAFNAQELKGIDTGDILRVKGCIRYKESEGYFGDAPSGPVRPYCMEIKVLEEKESV